MQNSLAPVLSGKVAAPTNFSNEGSSLVLEAMSPTHNESPTFHVGCYKTPSSKPHKIKRIVRVPNNDLRVSSPGIDPFVSSLDKDSSSKSKSDVLDVEMDDCEWELKRSRISCGVTSDFSPFDKVAGVGVDQPREQR
ncbi:unnamed protein product [Amaranthus hypochondriacus]